MKTILVNLVPKISFVSYNYFLARLIGIYTADFRFLFNCTNPIFNLDRIIRSLLKIPNSTVYTNLIFSIF